MTFCFGKYCNIHYSKSINTTNGRIWTNKSYFVSRSLLLLPHSLSRSLASIHSPQNYFRFYETESFIRRTQHHHFKWGNIQADSFCFNTSRFIAISLKFLGNDIHVLFTHSYRMWLNRKFYQMSKTQFMSDISKAQYHFDESTTTERERVQCNHSFCRRAKWMNWCVEINFVVLRWWFHLRERKERRDRKKAESERKKNDREKNMEICVWISSAELADKIGIIWFWTTLLPSPDAHSIQIHRMNDMWETHTHARNSLIKFMFCWVFTNSFLFVIISHWLL